MIHATVYVATKSPMLVRDRTSRGGVASVPGSLLRAWERGLEILDCPPSVYQTSPHVTMQISQAFEFPLCICILQAIKDWRWELPRNEATCTKTNNMTTGRSGMSLCHVSHCFMQAECIKNTEFYRGMKAECIKNTEFYRGMQAECIKNTEFYTTEVNL